MATHVCTTPNGRLAAVRRQIQDLRAGSYVDVLAFRAALESGATCPTLSRCPRVEGPLPRDAPPP